MIKHYLVFDKTTKDLLEDKYFYFCRFIDPSGELKANDEGLFEWVKESEFRNFFQRPVEPIEELIHILEKAKSFNGQIVFEEVIHNVDNF